MIFAMHGVVDGLDQACFCHRNLLDRRLFVEHLRGRREPYVELPSALAGQGDALTIDDATAAGAEAATLARECGHAVTIFINGYNVESLTSYFFALLNAALDASVAQSVIWEDRAHDLSTLAGRRAYRVSVKRRLATARSEEERQALVEAVARQLCGNAVPIPDHLRTLCVAEVRRLSGLGVAIENHGWTHTRLGALSTSEHLEDIRRGRMWIQSEIGLDGAYYAVPNGDGLPPWKSCSDYSVWFLLDRQFPVGRMSDTVYARAELLLATRDSPNP